MRRWTQSFGVGALLACATTLVACPDPPPPAPYQKPLPKRVEPKPPTPPEPLPLERPRPKAKVEDPTAVARRECDEVYEQRQRANEQMRRLFAKTSPKTIVPKLSPREQFVASCAAFPLDVIRCMNPRKMAMGAGDCIATLSKLDAKALEKLRNATKGKRKGRGRRRR